MSGDTAGPETLGLEIREGLETLGLEAREVGRDWAGDTGWYFGRDGTGFCYNIKTVNHWVSYCKNVGNLAYEVISMLVV